MNNEPTIEDGDTSNGWWPKESPVVQSLFRDKRLLGQVVRTAGGWRSYDLTRLNPSKTGSNPIAEGSVEDKEIAKAQVEAHFREATSHG